MDLRTIMMVASCIGVAHLPLPELTHIPALYRFRRSADRLLSDIIKVGIRIVAGSSPSFLAFAWLQSVLPLLRLVTVWVEPYQFSHSILDMPRLIPRNYGSLKGTFIRQDW